VAARALELCGLLGGSCKQAQAELMLRRAPDIITLPSGTIAGRILALAAALECEPGELVKHLAAHPRLLTLTLEALARVALLVDMAGPGNRQLAVRNPAMLQR
jgi:hypothetical protein